MAEHDVVAARGLSAARKADRCRDQVGDRVSAPPGRSPRVTDAEEGRAADRGQTRQEPQGISWITAVIHEKHGRVVAAGWSGEAPKATGASLMDVHAYPPNVS
jgi:hypothetical protein